MENTKQTNYNSSGLFLVCLFVLHEDKEEDKTVMPLLCLYFGINTGSVYAKHRKTQATVYLYWVVGISV